MSRGTLKLHCDDCDYGSFEYECPACGKAVKDDETFNDLWRSGPVPAGYQIECPHCGSKLSVVDDGEDEGWSVAVRVHRFNDINNLLQQIIDQKPKE